MQNIKKIHLLLNPVAGNGQTCETFPSLAKFCRELLPFDYQVSNYSGELISLAKNYGNLAHPENEILIVIGGDGSLNEVLSMELKTSNHPETPITYLLLVLAMILHVPLIYQKAGRTGKSTFTKFRLSSSWLRQVYFFVKKQPTILFCE